MGDAESKRIEKERDARLKAVRLFLFLLFAAQPKLLDCNVIAAGHIRIERNFRYFFITVSINCGNNNL